MSYPSSIMFSMNRLSTSKRAQIIGCLVEGMSLRATTRLQSVSINTVTKLLVDLGGACSAFQDRTLLRLPCERIQADEIWTYCYARGKNVPAEKQGKFGYGTVWTWVAMCPDTKLVPSWRVGPHDLLEAALLLQDVHRRIPHRFQLSTDGWVSYADSVEEEWGAISTTRRS